MSDPRTILFVCSGNTCRSPMAEAIARHLLASQMVRTMRGGAAAGGRAAAVLVRSAGVGAVEGEPAAPEARRALKALGIELGAHRSKPVTPRMIADAHEVFAMTAAHRQAVVRLDPAAEAKVRMIDPAGDVPDPIGGPDDLYASTARRLFDLIRRHFQAAGLIEG